MQSQSLLKVVKRMEKICYQTSMKNITCSPGQNVSLSLNNWFSWKHVFFYISEKFPQLQASACRSSHAPGCWTQSSSPPTKQTSFFFWRKHKLIWTALRSVLSAKMSSGWPICWTSTDSTASFFGGPKRKIV